MKDYLSYARREPQLIAAGAVAVIGALTICGFFFFQYVMHLPPCPLCLEQREAYYVCVPLAILLLVGINHGASHKVTIAGFAVIAGFMLWNAGLGVYHAGIEWKFWPGPQDCSGSIGKFGSARDVLKQLETINVVRCDEAAIRILGLSLAGWNV
ncbi:MAG: disulfide bond formation protein B, partial [Terriglobia bacterium]